MLLASLLVTQARNRFRLVTHGGVKPFEYFVQLLGKDHLQVFLKAIFDTPLLKTLT